MQGLPVFAGEEHSRMMVLDAASKFDFIECYEAESDVCLYRDKSYLAFVNIHYCVTQVPTLLIIRLIYLCRHEQKDVLLGWEDSGLLRCASWPQTSLF